MKFSICKTLYFFYSENVIYIYNWCLFVVCFFPLCWLFLKVRIRIYRVCTNGECDLNSLIRPNIEYSKNDVPTAKVELFSPNLSVFFYVWLCVNGTNRTYGNDDFDHPSIHDKLLPFDSTVVVIFIFGYFFQWTFGRWALFSRFYAVLIKKDITTMMTTWHLYTLDGTKQIWIKTMDWRTTIFFFSLHSQIELETHTPITQI